MVAGIVITEYKSVGAVNIVVGIHQAVDGEFDIDELTQMQC